MNTRRQTSREHQEEDKQSAQSKNKANKRQSSEETEPANTYSLRYKHIFQSGRWKKSEHRRFIEALKMYGKDWSKVQDHVRTRSSTQARSHAQKFF